MRQRKRYVPIFLFTYTQRLVGEKSTKRPSSDSESDCSDSAVPSSSLGTEPAGCQLKKKKSVNPEHGKKKCCENLSEQKIHPQLLKKIRTKHKQIQKYGNLTAGI